MHEATVSVDPVVLHILYRRILIGYPFLPEISCKYLFSNILCFYICNNLT